MKGGIMGSRPRRAPGFAAFALLLVLLVPARVVALCCLEVLADAPPIGAHGSSSHHGHDRTGGGENAFTTAAHAYDCDEPADPAPLLRERDRSEGASGASDSALPSPTILVASLSPRETFDQFDPSASYVARARVAHPLRL